MLQHILVATDFSARSQLAVRRAERVARTTGAALTLAHVVEGNRPSRLLAPARMEAISLLREATRELQEQGRAAEQLVLVGEPATGIHLLAEQARADLIVIGSHRDRALGTFTGRTAGRVVQASRRPVLITSMDPPIAYRRALLALDSSQPSLAAAKTAISFGLFDHTQVTMVHVGDALDGDTAAASAKLREFAFDLGLPPSTRMLVKSGGPAEAILAAAAEEAADLVIMGTSQREGVARFLIGSVAEAVSFAGNHDMLIVPAY